MKSAHKRKKSDNDAELFAAAMKDVRVMKPHNLAEREPMKRSQATLKESCSGNAESVDDSDSEFVRPGIQKAVPWPAGKFAGTKLRKN